ncbi:radical SAM family heme chaperone HemW [Leptolinea tardivitalis]|uniref:Heme chaperone HemW n=1 Tax=Leptolinea tardivitalis TaxID=229920 RepID=A0A0P6WR02_9CHLR|nr:radical SAM family heme chaperone HemW [Leptolinea tardivitalis]KPL71310.1 hypothetical protein ADM99_11460 [Leptolinea tardivitalis]GAP23085.1 coproporphyrinogen III oxidase [Leptolinea tardivitalis]
MDSSLYIHIPFCKRRCGYCDFVTFAGFERMIPEYIRAIEKQINLVGEGNQIKTLYFGGGTPSLISPNVYKDVFTCIRNNFFLLPEAEITLEANPGTIDWHSLDEYRKLGFNRISFGMQSAIKNELDLLDRAHTPQELNSAVSLARDAGFANINLDLIFGLPGQKLSDWKFSLEKALELDPEHLSLYSLIIEENTPLALKISQGTIQEPDDDLAAEEYEWSCAFLEKAGYRHYEISNWAKSSQTNDFRCKHNLQYWHLLPYYGLGCGAVGFLPRDSCRMSTTSSILMENAKWIGRYIKSINLACESREVFPFIQTVDRSYEISTFMFMGFRLLEEGINPVDFFQRFGVPLDEIVGEKIKQLLSSNLVEISPEGHYRLTRQAWLVANRVFREFVDE